MNLSRLLRFAGTVMASNLREPALPYRMTYIVTARCQCTCDLCGIWKRPPGNEISVAEVEEFFRRSGRFSWINLSGGEIFLHPGLTSIVRAISEHCRHLSLLNFPTNGFETGLIVDTVRSIIRGARIPRIAVTVSLDGPPRLHDRLRGLPGCGDRAIETFARLRGLRSGRFSVFLGWTLQDANRRSFDETFAAVRERIPDLRHSEFHINIAHASEHYYGNTDRVRPEIPQESREAFRRIAALCRPPLADPAGFLERRYRRLAEDYFIDRRTPVPCQALAASFFMDPSGEIYPCTIYNRPLGNIRAYGYDLRTLWASPARKQLRDEIRGGTCPHCWTPCEAYQSILAGLAGRRKGGILGP